MNDVNAHLKNLIAEIEKAWPVEEPPPENLLEPGGDDSEVKGVLKYFHLRRWVNVDINNAKISEELPFLYLSKAAIKYYIPVYLRYCLRCDPDLRVGCGGTPCIHLIHYLCRKKAPLKSPDFTDAQIKCFISVLTHVLKYPDYYLWDDNSVACVEKGIRLWERHREQMK